MSLLGGGGGGLSASGQANTPATATSGPVTVNNSAGLSTNSILAIAAALVGGVLLFALIHGRN